MRESFNHLCRIALLVMPALALSACDASPLATPSEPAPTLLPATVVHSTPVPPTATPSAPTITVEPAGGGPRTRVTVTGRGFPGGMRVGLYLGAQTGVKPETYGEAIADPTGALTIAFVMPGEWPNGEPITDRELAIVATNADRSVQAASSFNFEPVAAAITPPVEEGTPTDASASDDKNLQAAGETVSGFLGWLEKDPSGKSSIIYLTPGLRTKVQKGQTVAMLLGIQTMFSSFEVISVEPGEDENAAVVHVMLHFEQPLSRVFLLTQENGVWRIGDIAAGQ